MKANAIESATLNIDSGATNNTGGSFASATYSVCIVAVLVAFALIPIGSLAVFSVLAISAGWLEVHGFCGASHVGAITPYRVWRGKNNLWIAAATAYTFGGLATASMVGILVGVIGDLANLDAIRAYFLLGLAFLAIVLALREVGFVQFTLPQVRKQTNKLWANEFGAVSGAAMWGAHIGLAVATVVKHGGFYVVLGMTLFSGWLGGSLILVVYWLGRTLPVWCAPLLVSDPGNTTIIREVLAAHVAYYRMAALVLVSMALYLFALAASAF